MKIGDVVETKYGSGKIVDFLSDTMVTVRLDKYHPDQGLTIFHTLVKSKTEKQMAQKQKPQMVRIGSKRIRLAKIVSYDTNPTDPRIIRFTISGYKTLLSREYPTERDTTMALSVLDSYFEIINVNL